MAERMSFSTNDVRIITYPYAKKKTTHHVLKNLLELDKT
jgi:hypothetical protein